MSLPLKRNAPDRVQAVEGIEQSVRVLPNCSEYTPCLWPFQLSAQSFRYDLLLFLALRGAELAQGELA